MTGPVNFLTISILIIWLSIAAILGTFGVFAADPSQPPIYLLTAIGGPVALFIALYCLSSQFREGALKVDLHLLTAMQGWRVIGAQFIVLYVYGLLPGHFAWPAGLGDFVIGLAAPFVVWSMVTSSPHWRRNVILLNVFGLLDFAGAICFGVLGASTPYGLLAGEATTNIMNVMPLSLIPTFGVPFFIVLHILSLLQLRYNKGS